MLKKFHFIIPVILIPTIHFLLSLHWTLDQSSGGLHYLTALTACGTVAGNRFDGYFSTSPNGQAIEDSPESVLKGHDSWFQVAQSQCAESSLTVGVGVHTSLLAHLRRRWTRSHEHHTRFTPLLSSGNSLMIHSQLRGLPFKMSNLYKPSDCSRKARWMQQRYTEITVVG